MFKIILNIRIEKDNNRKLILKDKQSIFYKIINMDSDYWKLLHDSRNNIKNWFSFYINKNENKLYINISEERFNWLQLKKILEQNLNKKINIKKDLSINYSDYSIKYLSKSIIDEYDILETLSPIYINDYENNTKLNSINFALDITENNFKIIQDKILENINNYTWYNLTNNDITIIPTFKTRLLTWFNDKHAWSCYYLKIIFKPNENNLNMIYNTKKLLLTSFYKTWYTGYFILK
jgi:hypothetical protein